MLESESTARARTGKTCYYYSLTNKTNLPTKLGSTPTRYLNIYLARLTS